jgi:hypothetical protein
LVEAQTDPFAEQLDANSISTRLCLSAAASTDPVGGSPQSCPVPEQVIKLASRFGRDQ